MKNVHIKLHKYLLKYCGQQASSRISHLSANLKFYFLDGLFFGVDLMSCDLAQEQISATLLLLRVLLGY